MLFSSLLSLAVLAAPTLGFTDRNVHELSRSRARSHYSKRVAQPQPEPEAEAGVDLNVDVSLEKRASYNGRATYYAVGLGACGGYNGPGDFIVALNSNQYNQYGGGYPSKQCGRSITISYNGKQVGATIADECPTCDFGGLDMSEGLFTQFASTGEGVFYMSWWFNDENQSPATTTSETPQPKPTPTSTYTPPTSTYVEPTTTSTTPTFTYVEPSTTSSEAPTSSAAASPLSASVSTSSTATISASIASSSGTPDYFESNTTVPLVNATATVGAQAAKETVTVELAMGNLALFNQYVAYLGHIVVVGAQK